MSAEAYRAMKRDYAKTEAQREYRRLYMQRWREANRDKHNATANASHHRNKHKHVGKARARHLAKQYNMTEAQYVELLGEQGGVCAICLTDNPRARGGKFVVDHDHATGAVRGLLCTKCNTGLGTIEGWYAKHRDSVSLYLITEAKKW